MQPSIHPLTDVGGEIFAEGNGVATLNYTPNPDRAAIVTRIGITNVSGADNWRIRVNTREIMSDRILTVGLQHAMGMADQVSGAVTFEPTNIFQLFEDWGSEELYIPVPLGMTLNVASDGGATADIVITALEVPNSAIHPTMNNHYQGKSFTTPIVGYAAAAVAAAGDAILDTQVAPSWLPKVMNLPVQTTTQAGFHVAPIALFVEAGGVNTYSGAADHRSTTTYLRIDRKGVRLFTRSNLGLIARGNAAAAGSANKVYGTQAGKYRAFDVLRSRNGNKVAHIPTIMPNEMLNFYLGVAGDVTGGADYSTFLVKLIARITTDTAI